MPALAFMEFIMATQNKQYVFDILVKDKTDTVQLLAYAIYCIAKNERANQLHAEGKSQHEIELELKQYHETIVGNEVLQKLFHAEANSVHAKYTNKIELKIVKTFIKKVQTSSESKSSKTSWVLGKLGDAVAGILASIIVIAISVGLVSLFAGKEKRDAIWDAGTEEASNLVHGEVPILDKYRENLKKNREEKKRTESADKNINQ